MEIRIVVRQMSEELWRAHSPSLPGCAVQAATMEAAQDRMGTAVAAYISSLDAALPSRIDLVHAAEVHDTK